jgi:hypothetical protein
MGGTQLKPLHNADILVLIYRCCSDAFVQAFCDPTASQETRDTVMRAAVKNHGNIAKVVTHVAT